MDHPPRLVVGTAGHIDHGKSRLVTALTGTDPDRLPEERARGMTIDLGFAHTRIEEADIWFVDVPGHERFIRNMLAGATGIDVALLVVAADDSVMPQTREHAEVLRLLGVPRCVVVLTKLDLVDDEWAAQVEDEVRGLLGELGLTPTGCVWTSAVTGRGLDQLRALLARLARQPPAPAAPYRWFCLPIDRAFVVAGRGTVATGSVAHGAVAREDKLELWPAGRTVRVRDLETHHEPCAAAAGRMRLAVNLAGVAVEEVERGCTLATAGYLEPARCLDVWLTWLALPGKTPRRSTRLRVYLATTEVLAELRLLDKPPGELVRAAFGQLKLSGPVVTTWGQPFILRDEGGSRTLGGGRILRPVARPWTARRPADPSGLKTLLDGEPAARLEEVIRAAEWNTPDEKRLAVRAGLPDEATVEALSERLVSEGTLYPLEAASTRVWIHAAHLSALGGDLTRRLQRFVQDNPRLSGLPRSQWPSWMPGACPARLRPALAEYYVRGGHVSVAHDHIRPAGERPRMNAGEAALYEQLLAEFEQGGFQPPGLTELKCRTPRNERPLRELIELGVAQGRLVRIAPGMWLHERWWREAAARTVAAIQARGPQTMAQIRTLLDSTRKYVVPLVEQLDAARITRRAGDTRTLGPRAEEAIGPPPPRQPQDERPG